MSSSSSRIVVSSHHVLTAGLGKFQCPLQTLLLRSTGHQGCHQAGGIPAWFKKCHPWTSQTDSFAIKARKRPGKKSHTWYSVQFNDSLGNSTVTLLLNTLVSLLDKSSSIFAILQLPGSYMQLISREGTFLLQALLLRWRLRPFHQFERSALLCKLHIKGCDSQSNL